VPVSVKDISNESSLSNLLYILIDSEIQADGLCVKEKEAERKFFAGMAKLNKQKYL
jgi:hypothetical protein